MKRTRDAGEKGRKYFLKQRYGAYYERRSLARKVAQEALDDCESRWKAKVTATPYLGPIGPQGA